jgi:hypothetical protein
MKALQSYRMDGGNGAQDTYSPVTRRLLQPVVTLEETRQIMDLDCGASVYHPLEEVYVNGRT